MGWLRHRTRITSNHRLPPNFPYTYLHEEVWGYAVMGGDGAAATILPWSIRGNYSEID